MKRAKLQNHVNTSRYFLPVCALLALVLWWWPEGGYSHGGLMAQVLCAIVAYVLLETNNVNVLLRARSRSISSIWLALTACLGMLHVYQPSLVAAACLSASYYLLFRTYQHPQPVVDVFHAFVFLGAGSIFLPQMLMLVPFYYWHLAVFLRAFTLRTFWAGVLGLLTPCWFWGCWCWVTDNLGELAAWWQQFCSFAPISSEAYTRWTTGETAALCFCAGLTVLCGILYLQHSYYDKIRTRMIFYIYIFQATITLLLMALQPQYALSLLPLLMVSAVPFIAHYFTLTTTWLCTALFVLAGTGLLFVAWLTVGENMLMPWELWQIISNFVTQII